MASDAMRANRALWSHYLRRQWNPFLAPIGGAPAADAIADAIALWYALVWRSYIDRLYAANAVTVTKFVKDAGDTALANATPPAVTPPADADTVPPWLRAATDVYHPHAESRVRSRYPQPVR